MVYILRIFLFGVVQYIPNRCVLNHSSPQVSSKIQIKKLLTIGQAAYEDLDLGAKIKDKLIKKITHTQKKCFWFNNPELILLLECVNWYSIF